MHVGSRARGLESPQALNMPRAPRAHAQCRHSRGRPPLDTVAALRPMSPACIPPGNWLRDAPTWMCYCVCDPPGPSLPGVWSVAAGGMCRSSLLVGSLHQSLRAPWCWRMEPLPFCPSHAGPIRPGDTVGNFSSFPFRAQISGPPRWGWGRLSKFHIRTEGARPRGSDRRDHCERRR